MLRILFTFISLGTVLLAQVVFTSSNLPIVKINTNGQTIVNEPKIKAYMEIIYNGEGVRNLISDPANDYSGYIGIEIRGSTSQSFPKKQYAVELWDSLSNDIEASLLGFPKEEDWILFGPYNDKSLLRDVMAYKFAGIMGRYASRQRYCEVVINGEYKGIYILFEKIKRDKNRVNITKLDPDDIAGDDVTGGYVFKIDKTDGADTQGWYSDFLPVPWRPENKTYYQYHHPKYEDLAIEQKNYLKNHIKKFETVMTSSAYTHPDSGYTKYLDVQSFIDLSLVNEITKNPDAYRLSFFMSKERDSKGGKIAAGPVWDYNLSAANCNYFPLNDTKGWMYPYTTDTLRYKQDEWFFAPFWWAKLFSHNDFMEQYKNRYIQLRTTVLTDQFVTSKMDSLYALLSESRIRNFSRWPVLGEYVWPNYYIGNTYNEEYIFLRKWYLDRLAWMDSQFLPSAIEQENISPASFELKQNFPNPFNPSTTINYTIARQAFVDVSVYDIRGNFVKRLLSDTQEPGSHTIEFAPNGMASGVYLVRVTAGAETKTIKATLLK